MAAECRARLGGGGGEERGGGESKKSERGFLALNLLRKHFGGIRWKARGGRRGGKKGRDSGQKAQRAMRCTSVIPLRREKGGGGEKKGEGRMPWNSPGFIVGNRSPLAWGRGGVEEHWTSGDKPHITSAEGVLPRTLGNRKEKGKKEGGKKKKGEEEEREKNMKSMRKGSANYLERREMGGCGRRGGGGEDRKGPCLKILKRAPPGRGKKKKKRRGRNRFPFHLLRKALVHAHRNDRKKKGRKEEKNATLSRGLTSKEKEGKEKKREGGGRKLPSYLGRGSMRLRGKSRRGIEFLKMSSLTNRLFFPASNRRKRRKRKRGKRQKKRRRETRVLARNKLGPPGRPRVLPSKRERGGEEEPQKFRSLSGPGGRKKKPQNTKLKKRSAL